MKVSEAIERLQKQLDTLLVEKPLTVEQKNKVIEILDRQDKVMTSLENTAQSAAIDD